MDPLTMGLITGGASLLGSIFSSSTSASNTQAQIAAQQQMQAQSQQFNAQQADINRQFQEAELGNVQDYNTQMSNTAYQRASQDMQLAGLNPMMMFGSGGAASTPSVSVPSGSTASSGTPNVPMPTKTSPFAGIGDAVGKAVGSAVQAETFDKMKQEVSNLQVEQSKTAALRDNIAQQTETEKARTTREGYLRDLTGYGLPGAKVKADEAGGVLSLPLWARQAAGIADYGAGKVEHIGDAASSVLNSALKANISKGVKLRSDINRGNFIGKYGVPVDEYLSE